MGLFRLQPLNISLAQSIVIVKIACKLKTDIATFYVSGLCVFTLRISVIMALFIS